MLSLQQTNVLLQQEALQPKKSWGQHFLCDAGILRTIAASFHGDTLQHTVVELGAGLGHLTRALLPLFKQVIAVERDRQLVPHLQQQLPGLDLREANALTFDYDSLGQPLHVAGNLPYHLASRLIVNLAATSRVQQAVVLIQQEVARRLAAGPGSKTYGLLSVMVQRRFEVQLLKVVPKEAFLPPPKVTSQVVRLIRHAQVHPDEAALIAFAKLAFQQRRKAVRHALARHLGITPVAAEAKLRARDLPANARAEDLAVADFAALALAPETLPPAAVRCQAHAIRLADSRG